jgi:MFS family permease
MALQTRRPVPGEATIPATPGRNWLMLGVLLLGQFMCVIDVLVVNVAMPSIAHDLHTSGASLQLVVGGYTIAYAMLLITGAGALMWACWRRRSWSGPRALLQPAPISMESMLNDPNGRNSCMTLTTRCSRTLSTLPTGPVLTG